VCVGSNLESRVVLEGLIATGAKIVGLVTLPEGSPAVSDYVDLHPLCEEHGIETIDTANINGRSTIEAIAGLEPDYLYTLGWSQLFGDELLSLPNRYVVGSHPSPLPEGRGRAPVAWTILQGCRRSAVTLFRMDIGVDSGPILCQKWFSVPQQGYAGDLYELVAANLRDAFCELHEAQQSGTVIPELVQPVDGSSYRAKRTPADGHIDFCQSAESIERLVRAVSFPYPGAYSYYEGSKVIFWRASLLEIPNHVGTPGQILLKRNGRLLVQAGDSPLWLFDSTGGGGAEPTAVLRVGCKLGYAVEDELHRLQNELSRLRGEWDTWRQHREAA
jgi:methionyl-tRNA formyltransferase